MVKKRKSSFSRDLVQLLLGLVIIVLVNYIGSYVFHRFDLTTEKRFTLSPASKELMENLDDLVYVKVYLEGEFPAGFKRLRSKTIEMLDEFRAYNADIEYEFINPNESQNKEERQKIYQQLINKGIQPTNLQVKTEDGTSQRIIFPGAIVTYKGRETTIQLLKSRLGASPEEMLNNSIQELEYEISNAIRKLSSDIRERVAFVHGQGELNKDYVADISNALAEYYAVEHITLNDTLGALDGVKTAIIAKPDTAFNDRNKFIIDQFIMNGGRVLWLLDRVYANLDSLQSKAEFLAIAYESGVDDILFRYGVRVNTALLQDLRCAEIPVPTGYIGNQTQWGLKPWVYSPLIVPSSTHPIVKNLNAIRYDFATTIDTVGSKDVKKTVLLTTSEYSRTQNTPALVTLRAINELPGPEVFNRQNLPVAVLLEGNFTSIWKNSVPEFATIQQWSELKEMIKYKDISPANKMIVISDGDVIKNYIRQGGGFLQLGEDQYTGQLYANKKFILNCVNYLCDDEGLLTVRSKELKIRLLDKEKIRDERTKWQIINVAIPILLILLFALLQYYWRKKRYAS